MSDPVRFKYITTGMLIFHAAYSYYVNHAESSLLVNDFFSEASSSLQHIS